MGRSPRQLWKRFKSEIAFRVSTRPSYESYSWGPKRSWTAWCFYHALFVARLLSPLQWLKFYKRRPYKPVLHSKLEAKIRPDFHASDSERYMHLVLLGALVVKFVHQPLYAFLAAHLGRLATLLSWAGWILLLIFLLESIQWTFYYALFRPLVERAKLNLYDEAEYLIALPVVVLIQLVILSTLWEKSLVATAMMMLNVSDPGLSSETLHSAFPMSYRAQALFAALLGQSLIVIVIASLIRVVPTLHVRKRPNITVVGYGHVTRERILPALLAVYDPMQLAVASDFLSAEDQQELHSLGITSCFSACARPSDSQSGKANIIAKIAEWAEAHSKFAIVAVPTPAHLQYLLEFADRGLRFAMEKPVVGTAAELELLSSRATDQLFSEIFVFSYYWLEKGVSLNYLLSLNPHYRRLLDIEPDLSMQELARILALLGAMKDVTIEFIEGDETLERYWTELQTNGGMAMETLVHPLTFAVNLARYAKVYAPAEGLWAGEAPSIEWRRNGARAERIRDTFHREIGPTYVEIEGTLGGGIALSIRCGKYVNGNDETARHLVVEFENGWITSDLSNMVTRVFVAGENGQELAATIKNLKHLKSQKMRAGSSGHAIRYQHQVDLMNSFFVDGWGGIRYDDYPSQMDVLRELTRLIETIPDETLVPDDNDVQGYVWLTDAMMTDPAAIEDARISD